MVEVGIVAFILRAQDALQLPFGRLLYGDLSPIADGTRFGAAFIAMTLGYALVAALLYLAWLTDRTRAAVAGVPARDRLRLGPLALGPLRRRRRTSWLSELADWVHLSAGVLWVGGLVQLLVVVWPAAPDLRRRAFARFSRLATGARRAAARRRDLPERAAAAAARRPLDAGYGRVLLVKLALVALALGVGRRPPLPRPAAARAAPGGRAARALPRSLAGESAVGDRDPAARRGARRLEAAARMRRALLAAAALPLLLAGCGAQPQQAVGVSRGPTIHYLLCSDERVTELRRARRRAAKVLYKRDFADPSSQPTFRLPFTPRLPSGSAAPTGSLR